MQYPTYRPSGPAGDRVDRMAKTQYDWESWGERLRKQMRERKISLARLAARADAVAAESTLRSYLNKTRDISLKDFRPDSDAPPPPFRKNDTQCIDS